MSASGTWCLRAESATNGSTGKLPCGGQLRKLSCGTGEISLASDRQPAAAAMSTSSRLADHAFGAEAGELGVGEAELLVQHLVGVLADPRDARLGAVGHLRQLHGV